MNKMERWYLIDTISGGVVTPRNAHPHTLHQDDLYDSEKAAKCARTWYVGIWHKPAAPINIEIKKCLVTVEDA